MVTELVLVPAIARLVAADEDTVRDVIHAFDQKGLAGATPTPAGALGDRAACAARECSFIVAQMNARQMVPGRVLARPGSQTRAPASSYTGATRPPAARR